MIDDMAVYIANLGKYNEGYLVGAWFTFPIDEEDVKEKILRFGRAAVAAASMRGKSWLQIGSICMGIGGSIVDSDFIESYLGMRVESVDEVEIIRRMTEGIYDHDEFERALAWAKKNMHDRI